MCPTVSIMNSYIENGQEVNKYSQSNTFKHSWNVAMDERTKDTEIERN
jgi:hypothetical protein